VSLKDVAGTGTTIEIGGTTYRLGTLGIGSLAEMEDEVIRRRANPIDLAKKAASELPPERADHLLSEAVKACGGLLDAPTSRDLTAFWDSISGKVFVFWLVVRTHHPEIDSPQKAREVLKAVSLTEIPALAEKVIEASGLQAFADAAKNSKPPALPTIHPHESRGLLSIGS